MEGIENESNLTRYLEISQYSSGNVKYGLQLIASGTVVLAFTVVIPLHDTSIEYIAPGWGKYPIERIESGQKSSNKIFHLLSKQYVRPLNL